MKKYFFISLLLYQFLYSNFETISKSSLLHYRWNRCSQFGEDGIIDEIFRRMRIQNGLFVEFGAMDGIKFSNTYGLCCKGWKGLYIESDKKYEQALQKRFCKRKKINYVIEFIKWKENQKGRFLDDILDEFLPGREIDFMSIDIDGGDYFIWKSLKARPKVLCIECGFGYHPLFEKPVSEEAILSHPSVGQPMSLFIKEGYKQGYIPIAYNFVNLFLIRKDYAHFFDEIKKDPIDLFKDSFKLLDLKFKENFFMMRNRLQKPLEDKDYDKILPLNF
ncbi:MAG: hypothetical protein S4CHLAM20_08510 [Chlamydiia bacterium]|nr:hypothetical protein [Chlamydiia bacterium]